MTIKSPREMELMRQAGKVVAGAKAAVAQAIKPGITTRELDRIAEEEIRKQGAVPAFKGLYGFPATVCTSINEEIVHGIPGDRAVKNGDILSVDFGAIVGGFYADSAFTIGVGVISPEAQALIDATHEALQKGIEQVKEGARIGDISAAVQAYAEHKGYGVVRQYVGHGIGRALHEEPQVPNYGTPGRGPLLKTGMAIAIEPMLNVGTWKTRQLDDGWTVVTEDGALSAHFEDTVGITENGVEVFTESERNN
ncbi:MAG: type I methionyl aminopeptidase [Chloroflexi bacterium]|nr:type I methionyl aminopeptidase [Chloroflexota bacterium]